MGTLSHKIGSSEDFAALWRKDRQIYISAGGNKKLRHTGTHLGIEWARRSAIKCKGKISHRGRHYANQIDTLIIRAEWRSRVDWLTLFRRICGISQAAHGMLHLYGPEELSDLDPNDSRLYREGLSGQSAFTYSVDPYGMRRAPGPGDPNLQTYRKLPELTWATWLGPNFDGQYDMMKLGRAAALSEEHPGGFLVALTDQIDDVLSNFASFRTYREKAKATGFPDSFIFG